jgi:hypothetical protein
LFDWYGYLAEQAVWQSRVYESSRLTSYAPPAAGANPLMYMSVKPTFEQAFLVAIFTQSDDLGSSKNWT